MGGVGGRAPLSTKGPFPPRKKNRHHLPQKSLRIRRGEEAAALDGLRAEFVAQAVEGLVEAQAAFFLLRVVFVEGGEARQHGLLRGRGFEAGDAEPHEADGQGQGFLTQEVAGGLKNGLGGAGGAGEGT